MLVKRTDYMFQFQNKHQENYFDELTILCEGPSYIYNIADINIKNMIKVLGIGWICLEFPEDSFSS